MSTPLYAATSSVAKDERYFEQECAANRVFLHVEPVWNPVLGVFQNRIVQITMAEHPSHGPVIPPRVKTIRYDVSDWHGEAFLDLPEAWPESARQIALAEARAIHGPESQEACCRRHRERLLVTEAAA